MAIKLIAADLDGTLMLPDHQTVGEKTKDVLRQCSEKGVKIAIATGRTFSLVTPVIEQVPFVDYVIYSNGAGVYDCNTKKRIYSDPIDRDTAFRVLHFLQSMPIYYEFYADGAPHAEASRIKYFCLKGVPRSFAEELLADAVRHDDINEFLSHADIEKINLFSLPEETNEKIRHMLAGEKSLSVTSSIECNIEVNKDDTNKGKALSGLCDLLGITAGETMCFGDGGNDVEMLRFADYSFAMENATEAAKSAAKFSAPSNGDEGVGVVADRVVLRGE